MDVIASDPKSPSIASNRAEHDKRITEKLRRELGPQICELLEDSTVIEIMLNPDGTLWVERLGAPMEKIGSRTTGKPWLSVSGCTHLCGMGSGLFEV